MSLYSSVADPLAVSRRQIVRATMKPSPRNMVNILRGIIALMGLGALFAVGSPIKHPIFALQLALAEAPASLPVPVDGVRPSALRDSWRAPRDGGRHHQGVDIFAKPGTPVRSTTEGIIIRVGQNSLGGNVVSVMGPGRQTHYYAHLRDFGAFETGDRVLAGDIIGYVGDTGNARGTPHHLHYGVYELGGMPINPYPLLTARASHRAERPQL
jgi:murein DD-endopeptidase MepM/ murein hydrolase activator NlpD